MVFAEQKGVWRTVLYNGFRFVSGYRDSPTLNTQWRPLCMEPRGYCIFLPVAHYLTINSPYGAHSSLNKLTTTTTTTHTSHDLINKVSFMCSSPELSSRLLQGRNWHGHGLTQPKWIWRHRGIRLEFVELASGMYLNDTFLGMAVKPESWLNNNARQWSSNKKSVSFERCQWLLMPKRGPLFPVTWMQKN